MACLKLLMRKKVVAMRLMRKESPLKRPWTTPYSAARLLPVSRTPPYLVRSRSPWRHVLIVSMGCVTVAEKNAPVSAPAASATCLSMPELSTSLRWIWGVTPSMAMVKSDSRPSVIVRPRRRPAPPKLRRMPVGVPRMDPPKRCCWIIVSSQTEQGTPEARPPRNAPPISASSLLATEPSARWKKPVVPNCTAVVPPRFSMAMGRPR
mmetsp:Transcript_9706/g.31902  ORF Transcript_9706/g.31902 Transcript_9706/m.31902 type:complete len:207 (+) Transcript_9706:222-842(+)